MLQLKCRLAFELELYARVTEGVSAVGLLQYTSN